MPRRKEIKNNLGTELFSIQVYPQSLTLLFLIYMQNLKSGPQLKLLIL